MSEARIYAVIGWLFIAGGMVWDGAIAIALAWLGFGWIVMAMVEVDKKQQSGMLERMRREADK